MRSIWTLIVIEYGGHDVDVSSRAYEHPDAMLPALRRALADVDYALEEGDDPNDPELDFDDLLDMVQRTAWEATWVEVRETTLFSSAAEEDELNREFQ